jgi:membrane-associated phospholipid phosphatase
VITAAPWLLQSPAVSVLDPVLDLDRRLLLFARTHGHSAASDRVVRGGSRLGEHAACWLVLGAAGALLDETHGRRRRWRRGMTVVAGSYVANYAIKITVRRHRPELPGLPPLTPTVSELSFPSAHATSSFAAARAYRGLAPTPALYGAALALAVSRPYLGVHYPSDVATGAALGTLIASRWPACP